MDLPTYTNIWRIEKRLYKLYDFRLPMPLPVGQIAVFAAIAVPYVLVLTFAGLPFSHTLVWLYALPPAVLAWLATRPVIESKRLPELLASQLRYLGEPRTWCRLAPLAEPDEVTVTCRVWRRDPPQLALAATRTRLALPSAASPAAAEADVPEADAAEPVVTDIAATEPAVAAAVAVAAAEPVVAAAVSEPAVAEPVVAAAVAEPAVAGPAVAAAVSEPVVAGPAVAGPAVAAAVSEPAVAGPAVAEPVVVKPVIAEPAAAGEAVPVTGTARPAPAGLAVPAPAGFLAGRPRARGGSVVGNVEPPAPVALLAEPDEEAFEPEEAGPPLRPAARTLAEAAIPWSRVPEWARRARVSAGTGVFGRKRPLAAGPAPQPEQPAAAAQLAGLAQLASLARPQPSGPPGDPAPLAPAHGPEPADRPAAVSSAPAPAEPALTGGDGTDAATPDAASLDDEVLAAVDAPAAEAEGHPAATREDVTGADLTETETEEAPAAAGPAPAVAAAGPAPAVAAAGSAPAVAAAGPAPVMAAAGPAPVMAAADGAPAFAVQPVPAAGLPGVAPAVPADDIPAPVVPHAPAAAPAGARPPRPRAVTVQDAQPAPQRPLRMVERALSGPAAQRADGWRERVVVVPGGHRPGRPDPQQRDQARIRLPITGERRIVVLGCTVGAGQTVTTLMTGEVLARTRDEPVAVLDLNPGPGSLAGRAAAAPPLQPVPAPRSVRLPGTAAPHRPGPSPLEVLTASAGSGTDADADPGRVFELMSARFPLTLADPSAGAVPRVLPAADQLLLVAPASAAAASALAMTIEWLEAHGHADLVAGAVVVVNGVSLATMPHAEQAESIARGRCRAIVRVPWDDQLQARARAPRRAGVGPPRSAAGAGRPARWPPPPCRPTPPSPGC